VRGWGVLDLEAVGVFGEDCTMFGVRKRSMIDQTLSEIASCISISRVAYVSVTDTVTDGSQGNIHRSFINVWN
jgi:hypothetical protein